MSDGLDVAQIAKVAFTSPDRVRAVIHNFNDDGFDSLVPKYAGGRPLTFAGPARPPTRNDRDHLDRAANRSNVVDAEQETTAPPVPTSR